MHVCIVGSGAIGTFLAARLAAGTRVTLVDRRAESGRAAVEVLGQLPCRTEVAISPRPVPADWVIVATKVTALVAVCDELRGCAGTVVFAQNGVGVNALVAERLPGVTLARALVWAGATRAGDRTVRCTGFTRIVAGGVRGDPDLSPLAATLRAAGLATDLVPDADRLEWEKALWNIGVNAACAITGELNGAMVDSPPLTALLRELVREAQRVAAAAGHHFDLEEEIIRLTGTTAANVNSMLADVRAGRATEIEYLNGAVVRRAAALGLAAPANAAVYYLLKHLEARAARPAV